MMSEEGRIQLIVQKELKVVNKGYKDWKSKQRYYKAVNRLRKYGVKVEIKED